MRTVLNPLEMQVPKDRMLLRCLFNSNMAQVKWLKNYDYQIIDEHQKTLIIQLTHDVLPVNRDGQLYYRVISNQVLGQGGYGQVFPIANTILFQNMSANMDYIDENMVVKIVTYRYGEDSLANAKREVTYSKSLGMEIFIPVERPTTDMEKLFLNQQATCTDMHLVMRKIPGVELCDMLSGSYAGLYCLLSNTRYLMTIAVLDAFKQQLFDKKIMHGDIKLDNILVDMGLTQANFIDQLRQGYVPSLVTANLIDFARTREYGEKIACFERVRTHGYAAPELYQDTIASEQIDIYALGVTLAFLWGFHDIVPIDAPCYQDDLQHRYHTFFQNDMDFTLEQYQKIHYLMLKMTEKDPSLRGGVESVIMQFQTIFNRVVNNEEMSFNSISKPSSSREISPVSIANTWSYPHDYSSANARKTPAFFSAEPTKIKPPLVCSQLDMIADEVPWSSIANYPPSPRSPRFFRTHSTGCVLKASVASPLPMIDFMQNNHPSSLN